MTYDKEKCEDCALSGSCLFQDNDDVESCKEKSKEERE